jgi:hypothetical protein
MNDVKTLHNVKRNGGVRRGAKPEDASFRGTAGNGNYCEPIQVPAMQVDGTARIRKVPFNRPAL